VASLDGAHVVAGTREGRADEAEHLGSSLADELLARGADLIRAVQEVR
jgi:porphobilinogen deaminase